MAKIKKNKLADTNALGARYATNPTPELALELINAFEGFLEKYVVLLSPEKESDKPQRTSLTSDTKDFLRLFASREEFKANPRMAYRTVAKRLPNMAVQSLLNTEDIRQSLTMLFLEKAQKFNPNIGGFTGYMKYHFKFAVKTWLFESHNDAAKYQPLYDEPIEEEAFFGMDIDYDDDKIRIHNGHEVSGDTIVDKYIDLPRLTPALISNPSPPFDTLWTKQERAVIVKVYVEDKSFSATADELGYSNATIVRTMHHNALDKFRAYAKGELNC